MSAARRRRPLLGALVALAACGPRPPAPAGYHHPFPTDSALISRLALLGAGDPGSADRFLGRLSGLDGHDGAALAAVLEPWIAGAESLPPPRRAAASVAADRALTLAPMAFPAKDPRAAAAAGRLAGLGARFAPGYGAYLHYDHTWLKAATVLDPDGEAGQWARLLELEQPCEYHPVDEAFRWVINGGETLLADARDSAVLGRAHLAVALAYEDIVALARFDGPVLGAGPPSRYRPEERVARTRALAHYRAALAFGLPAAAAGVARRGIEVLTPGGALPVTDDGPTIAEFVCLRR